MNPYEQKHEFDYMSQIENNLADIGVFLPRCHNDLINTEVRLSDYIDKVELRGRNWQNVVIHGPAVIVLTDGTVMDSCSWSTNNPESIVIPIPDGQSKAGMIRVAGCGFTGCRFVNIAIAVSASHYDAFVQQLFGANNHGNINN